MQVILGKSLIFSEKKLDLDRNSGGTMKNSAAATSQERTRW